MSKSTRACALVVAGTLFQVACSSAPEPYQEASAAMVEQAEGEFCGGFAGIPCPEGLTCVDDPNDSCDPSEGGADCGGICVSQDTQPGRPKNPQCEKNPTLRYASRDPNECLAITFVCGERERPFFNECGCGCRVAPPRTCDYNNPDRVYISKDPEQCALIRYTCAEGQAAFSDECGCGCQSAPQP